jgi:regulator of RNase E activity RraB
MKLIGNYVRRSLNEAGNVEITFELPSYGSKMQAEELQKHTYTLDIREPRNTRSLNQNALMWELLGEISMKMNGTRDDDENIYCQCLQMAGVKAEYLACTPAAVDTVKKYFRAVKEVETRQTDKGEMIVLKCFIGSSKMTVKEMSALIDVVMQYAEKVGINTDYYHQEFEGMA